jgi:hypothetical protein
MIDIINFKSLALEDKETIESFIDKSNLESYENLFSSLYMWRKFNDLKYAVIDGALVFEKNEEGRGIFYSQPVGCNSENISSIIEKLVERNRELGRKEMLFGDSDEKFIEDLKKYTDYKVEAEEDTDDAEYVYSINELIELKGKKFHGKKNHVNSFIKSYNYEIREINSDEIIEDCLLLLHKWHEEVAVTVDQEMLAEIEAIKDVFRELKYFDLKSIAVYVEGKLAGFAVGEKVNDKMAVIHIERGETDFNGIYAFVNREFLVRNFSDLEFVNRQEDTGNEGLRKAKTSYHPVKMVRKYLIRLS